MTVHVIATGGTIASHFDGAEWTEIGGQQLIDEAGPHPCPVVVRDIATGPSSNLTVDDMVRIAEGVRAALSEGARGVVVVHGTDTIELTAFVTSLLLGVQPGRRPVVFTGSMRVHSHARPDGPQNLRDAIAIAADAEAVGREVVVCLDGEVHASEAVTKVNATSVDAFASTPFGTVASTRHGVVQFHGPPSIRPAASAFHTDVPLLTAYPGIDPGELARLTAGRRGVVVEGFGDLNVPRQLWAPIHHAWNAGVLVVLGSRPFTPTQATDDLAMLGAVGAGGLTAQKARLATMAALGTYPDRADAIEFLRQRSLTYDAHDRSTS